MRCLLLIAATILLSCNAFSPSIYPKATSQVRSNVVLFNGEDDTTTDETASTEKKVSLEEKMAAWEASDEEVKAATLGGIVPGRSDAFDVGLYIAFPLMVVSGLAFAFFPLIMGNLDVDSVGPPPSM